MTVHSPPSEPTDGTTARTPSAAPTRLASDATSTDHDSGAASAGRGSDATATGRASDATDGVPGLASDAADGVPGRATVRALALVALLVGSLLAVPLPAAAHDTAVAVDVTADPVQPPVGENATIAVEVANLVSGGDPVTVRRITIENGSEELEELSPNRVIGGGNDRTWTVNASFDSPGARTLDVSIRLDTGGSQPTTLDRTVDVTVVDPHPALALSASPVGPAGRSTLSLTVANGRTEPINGVEVAVASDDATFSESRRVVSSLAAGAAATLTFPARNVSTGPGVVRTTVSYTTANGNLRRVTRALAADFERVENPANVTLTGVRVEREGRTLEVRGSASNPGATNASGVVLRVKHGEHVAPGDSQRDFFVGDVPASDFASFQVNARLTDEVNGTVAIPIAVEYAVDGQRVTRTTRVHYRADYPDPGSGGGGGGAGLVVLVLALLAVVAGVLGWRRYR